MAGLGRSLAAVVLLGGGAALVYMALQTQNERDAAIAVDAAKRAPKPPPVATTPPAATTTTAVAASAPTTRPTTSSSAAPATSATAASSASAAASASAAPASGTGETFKFAAGGIVMPKDELHRLVTSVAQLRSKPKIAIEAFGDEAGAGDKGVALARRRAYLVRQLLADDMGIEGERLVVTTPDVATDASGAGTVRVHGTEGKSP